MKLSSVMIFYWFHMKFPKAKHLHYNEKQKCMVEAPLFYCRKTKLSGHVVVLSGCESEQIVHLTADVLPILVGKGEYPLTQSRRERIILEENIPVGEVFNVLQEIFERYYQWFQDLERATDIFLSFDSIVRSCDTMLEDPLALVDTQFRYVSYSKRLAYESGYETRYVGEERYLPLEYINLLTAMPDFKEIEKKRSVFQYVCVENMLHKNIFYQDGFVGRLALPYAKTVEKNRYYEEMLEIVAERIEMLYENIGSFWHRKNSDSRLSRMIKDLLDGKMVEMDALNRLLSNRGCKSGDQFLLIQMRAHFTANEDQLSSSLTAQLERMWPGTCCIPYQNKLVVFVNQSYYERNMQNLFTQELAVFLRDSLLLAGLSRRFEDLNLVRTAYLQTEIALEIGQERNPTYWYLKYDDYAYYDLLRHGCRSFFPEQVCSQTINILREYDRKNHTELNRTLKVYLEKQYNAVETAQELCVARSTFLKRYARIMELTNLNLEDFQQRVYLLLSYELFEQFCGE